MIHSYVDTTRQRTKDKKKASLIVFQKQSIFRIDKDQFYKSLSSSSLFGEASIQGESRTGLEPMVYLFITPGLPESDAGSDSVEPASSFVI